MSWRKRFLAQKGVQETILSVLSSGKPPSMRPDTMLDAQRGQALPMALKHRRTHSHFLR